MEDNVLLKVENLKKKFVITNNFGKKKYVRAVDGVSFGIAKGETLGLVGESGCGKSTLGRTLLRLLEPEYGRIFFAGEDITQVNMRPYRQKMQIVFQDPAGSLDPRTRICDSIAEGMLINRIGATKRERLERVLQLLEKVGLNVEHVYRYPHEFSGGQLQRIGIARALAVSPEFIVCDEVVSALDVSCQSQIINLLEDMQEELNLTYLFISHDVSVVRHISDHIGVMYLGKLVELGTSQEIGLHAVHPYTKTLLASIPIPDPVLSRTRERMPVSGELSNPPLAGCRFCTRCDSAKPICFKVEPEMKEIAPGHYCACLLFCSDEYLKGIN